ncbi:D-alanyl-D-alanine carboxypeptidase family protein [Velocimicrobium porci]|uniref:serine-type D-Ala-D-Ala carboxypeptidase n=1 Tax=Velocimicrobium porci TaxID=2606634 RepID=A0A6L5XYX4_9FIRM|nr:D-alanyl-D-alanine carboxypeptidase family protein [Velocimicrobium porci]MSS63408.1 D-alanyl-D-alanine carboxypeptidase [Velocimicrobium porci]
MKKIISIILIFLLLFPACFVQAEEKEKIEEPSGLYALCSCLMDADSGRVLFEKNGEEQRAMASTTKIMTLIVTLENCDLNEVVTISQNAARQPDVQLNVNIGEKYYLKDLCYSLMLESHNDSAVAIAEHVGKSVENFANMMNEKAKELDLVHTHFITPNGLDAENADGIHGTTAVELAKIMRYCIKESPKKDLFLKITGTSSHSFSDLDGKRTFSCRNHNAFLNMMEGALSGKTGFTSKAGYCYVGALERDGKMFVVALLGCGWPNNKSYKWSDTKKLMSYGIDNYEYRTVWKEPKLSPVFVKNGIPKSGEKSDLAYANLYVKCTKQDKEREWLLRNDENVHVSFECKNKLEAPVKEETKVGRILYSLEGTVLKEYPIVTDCAVEKLDYWWCCQKILKQFFL